MSAFFPSWLLGSSSLAWPQEGLLSLFRSDQGKAGPVLRPAMDTQSRSRGGVPAWVRLGSDPPPISREGAALCAFLVGLALVQEAEVVGSSAQQQQWQRQQQLGGKRGWARVVYLSLASTERDSGRQWSLLQPLLSKKNKLAAGVAEGSSRASVIF